MEVSSLIPPIMDASRELREAVLCHDHEQILEWIRAGRDINESGCAFPGGVSLSLVGTPLQIAVYDGSLERFLF